MKQEKRRAGRPTKPGTKGEKATLGIRANSKLKDRLLKAAEANSRSLSQEAELRLEASFRDQDLHQQLVGALGGPAAHSILSIVGAQMARAGDYAHADSGHPAIDWTRDPYAYREAMRAALRMFIALRPQGDIEKPIYGPTQEATGRAVARKRIASREFRQIRKVLQPGYPED